MRAANPTQPRSSISGVMKPESVQLEGVVLMNMLRHAEAFLAGGASEDSLQNAEGKLVGLLVGSSLEVTNCFPSPLFDSLEDASRREQVEHTYQMDMLKTMRMFRQDHVAVGWYTTASVANFATKAFVEHQFGYQQTNEESVVLVIDLNNMALLKANPSSVLSPFATPPSLVRAYRLSDAAMSLYENNVFTPATMRQHGLTFENIFEQLPVTIHNSDLANILLHQFGAPSARAESLHLLKKDQQTSQQQIQSALQRHMRDLSICADELGSDTGRAVTHCLQQTRYLQSRQQYISRREADNRARVQRGETVTPITEEEILQNVRQPPTPNQLPALLLASQLGQTAAESSRVSASVLQRNQATSLLTSSNSN